MVTNSWMGVVSPTSAYLPNSTWLLGEKKSGIWSEEENKIFENALAHFDITIPEGWERVAAMLPGKTVRDVVSHYRDLEDDVNHIEAGLIPCPGYSSSSFTFGSESGFDGIKQPYCVGGKRGRYAEHERKKGVPWTEEEHKQFLMGLRKHGKGDWRNISHNFVVTRTPTQVASHAQKYFNRHNSSGKEKRRASIHDITIANMVNDSPSPSTPRSDQLSSAVDSDQTKAAAQVYSPSLHGHHFTRVPNGTNSFGIKLEPQNPFRGGLHESVVGHPIMFI